MGVGRGPRLCVRRRGRYAHWVKYEVTVNRDHIDTKHGLPIRVTAVRDPNEYSDYAAIRITSASVVRHGPARRNGATVWIECDSFEPIDA